MLYICLSYMELLGIDHKPSGAGHPTYIVLQNSLLPSYVSDTLIPNTSIVRRLINIALSATTWMKFIPSTPLRLL